MREIAFKAKRIDNGEWVEGHLIQSPYMGEIRSWISTPEDKTRLRAIATYYGDWRAVEVGTDTICQYTGLNDKNGNKIWENDVVETYNSQGQECHIEQIIWADYGLNEGWCSKGIKSLIKYDNRVFNTGFGKSDSRKCEVIGNIFDNPKLIGEQNG